MTSLGGTRLSIMADRVVVRDRPRFARMSDAGQGRGVCLVIGAGDGLGASIARAFAREGLDVCVTRRPRHTDAIDALAEAIRAEGGKAYSFGLDARVEADVARARRADRARDRRDRGSGLQHRRECAFPGRRDDDAGLFEGLGDGGAGRLPRQPRGRAGDDRARARHDPVHRRDREPSRRRGLFRLRRGEARAAGAGPEFWRANWGRRACMSPMSSSTARSTAPSSAA